MLLQQAFAIIQFKVEAVVIKRRPEFQLADRLLLGKNHKGFADSARGSL